MCIEPQLQSNFIYINSDRCLFEIQWIIYWETEGKLGFAHLTCMSLDSRRNPMGRAGRTCKHCIERTQLVGLKVTNRYSLRLPCWPVSTEAMYLKLDCSFPLLCWASLSIHLFYSNSSTQRSNVFLHLMIKAFLLYLLYISFLYFMPDIVLFHELLFLASQFLPTSLELFFKKISREDQILLLSRGQVWPWLCLPSTTLPTKGNGFPVFNSLWSYLPGILFSNFSVNSYYSNLPVSFFYLFLTGSLMADAGFWHDLFPWCANTM